MLMTKSQNIKSSVYVTIAPPPFFRPGARSCPRRGLTAYRMGSTLVLSHHRQNITDFDRLQANVRKKR